MQESPDADTEPQNVNTSAACVPSRDENNLSSSTDHSGQRQSKRKKKAEQGEKDPIKEVSNISGRFLNENIDQGHHHLWR